MLPAEPAPSFAAHQGQVGVGRDGAVGTSGSGIVLAGWASFGHDDARQRRSAPNTHKW
jgi:hypothetical protein